VKGSETPAPQGGWTVGLLAVVGTLVLAYLLSPGLRSDLGWLAALLSNIGATSVTDWLLSSAMSQRSPTTSAATVTYCACAETRPTPQWRVSTTARVTRRA
jgi:drug/metabolite transporter (DMT)-like permease